MSTPRAHVWWRLASNKDSMEVHRAQATTLAAYNEGSYSLISQSFDLEKDLTLRPKLIEDGTIQHPDVVLEQYLLCLQCKNIIQEAQDALLKERSVPFHETVDELKRSVLQGCHLCSFFWALYCTEGFLHQPRVTIERIPRLMILKYSKSPQHIRITTSNANPNAIAPHYIKAITSVSNASNACFNIAASWISECLTEHTRCRRVQSTASQMPTRLIDLRASTPSMIRLVHPTMHVAYLTVSHCWGAADVLKLTKENLERLLDGFEEAELPRLYRDCIHVARRLGFEFLWLDSLCIIQDSEEDWLEEGWRMGDVYRGSTCTIAAVSCSDSASSLFTKYHPLTSTDIYFPTLDGRGTLRIPYPYREFAEPLYDRAWVLQERLLSPRTLEYTFAGMGWHCEEMVFHRPDPDMRLEDEEAINAVSPLIDQWRELSNIQSSRLTNADRLRGQQAWMEILRTYAMTKLTFENDRPHAINGIISVLQRQTGLKLHAGVCVDFAPYSLLWKVVSHNGQWLYGQYRCPSWSSSFLPIECETLPGLQAGTWSYQAEMKFADQILQLSCRSRASATIETSQRKRKDPNDWLAIRDAVMLLETDVEQTYHTDVFAAEDDIDISLDFIPKGRLEVDFLLLLVEEDQVAIGAQESQEMYYTDVFDLLAKPMGSELMLPSKTFQAHDNSEKRKETTEVAGRGIILIKSPVDTLGEVWVRVGTFSIMVPEDRKEEIFEYFPEQRNYLVI